MFRKDRVYLAGLAAALLLAAPAGAALLVYEPFNTDTEVGFAGSSVWTLGGLGTFAEQATSIDFSDYDDNFGAGGKGVFTRNGTSAGYIYRQLSVAPTAGQTFWTSYLIQGEVLLNQNSWGMTSVTTGTGEGSGERFSTSLDSPDGGINNVYSGVGVDGTETFDTNWSHGSYVAYLVIGKFTDTGGDGWDAASMWILSAADYDAIKAGGITEAELDSNKRVKISDTGGNQDFLSTYYSQFRFRRKSANIDELRIATTLGEALGVPEPATLGLMALGGAAMLVLRRRRR